MDAKELLEIGLEMRNEFPARAEKIIEAAEILEKYQTFSNKTVCAYCGHETDKNDTAAIFDHIMTCEKRPEKKLLEKAFEVEDRLYGFIKHLILLGRPEYFHTDCETCKEILESMKIYNSEAE